LSEVSAKHVFGLSLLLALTTAITITVVHAIPASGQAITELSVNKADNPDPVQVGELLAYTINVANFGPATAEDVVLEDVLPEGTEFIDVDTTSGDCTFNDATQTVLCALGPIAPGETEVVTIFVEPTEAGEIANTVTVESPNAAPAANTETTTVVSSDDNDGGISPLPPSPAAPDEAISPAPAVTQESGQDAESGDAIPDASIENTGDNAALCVPVQQTPVTGNQQTGQGNLGIGTEDDTVFGSPELGVNPEQATNCAQVIQPV
jgi:uncharacterized repeat protein (TIGR01451 family)